MQSKSWPYLLITLAPVYISLAVYLGFVSSPTITLSSLLRLSRANLLRQYTSQFSTPASAPSTLMSSSLKLTPRPSEERGHADHDWLKTFHTFSFASCVFSNLPCFASYITCFSYQDNEHGQYGPLRVINEDRVESKTGFGTHSHREFEIFSYVVSGTLEQ